MDEVRFRGQVRPGDRLVLVSKAVRVNRRQTVFETQGFVDNNMVFHARIIGVALPTDAGPGKERGRSRPINPSRPEPDRFDRRWLEPRPVSIRPLTRST